MSANDDLLMQFVEMTGSDPDTASYFLELSGYDLEAALNLLFSGDIKPPSSQTPSSSIKTDEKDTNNQIELNDTSFPTLEDEEDSIREADPVRQQVLLDFSSPRQRQEVNMGSISNLALSRAEDSSVEWMFPPPNHLSFPGTLAEARATAKKDQKWILVNIQCDKAFSSHLLNRDVWTNETLVSLIRMNFVFWQRGTTSQDGQMFATMHRLSPEMGGEGFPVIGLVDARTGALISTIKVTAKTDANDVILKLMEFLEANNINGLDAPVARPRVNSKSSELPPVPTINDNFHNVDNDLATALDMSMKLPSPPVEEDSLTPSTSGDKETETRTSEKEVVTDSNTSSPYSRISLEDTIPPTDAALGIKISLKLAPDLVQAIASDTKSKLANSLVRSFHAEDHTVQHVYAAVYYLLQAHMASLPASCQNRDFDLLTAFPRCSLNEKRDLSVSAAGLKGAQVIMQWL